MRYSGYGFCFSNIPNEEIYNFILMESHRKASAEFFGINPCELSIEELKDFIDNSIKGKCDENICNYVLLASIIAKECNLSLDLFIGCRYFAIMREDCQPWELPEEERNITKEEISNMLSCYAKDLPSLGNPHYIENFNRD